MEIVEINQLNTLNRHEVILKPKLRAASLLRLAGLISKKEAKKMLTMTKKARIEWR